MNLENNNKRTRKVLKVKDLLAVIFIVISIPATNAENRTSYPSNVTHDASVNALLLRQTSSEQGYGQDGVMFIFDERQRVELLLFGEKLDTVARVKFSTANNSRGGPCTGQDGHYQVWIRIMNEYRYLLLLLIYFLLFRVKNWSLCRRLPVDFLWFLMKGSSITQMMTPFSSAFSQDLADHSFIKEITSQ